MTTHDQEKQHVHQDMYACPETSRYNLWVLPHLIQPEVRHVYPETVFAYLREKTHEWRNSQERCKDAHFSGYVGR